MMHSAEPMALGSPGSPPIGGPGMVQSPFLPAYLMGDTTPLSSPRSVRPVGLSDCRIAIDFSPFISTCPGSRKGFNRDTSPKQRYTSHNLGVPSPVKREYEKKNTSGSGLAYQRNASGQRDTSAKDLAYQRNTSPISRGVSSLSQGLFNAGPSKSNMPKRVSFSDSPPQHSIFGVQHSPVQPRMWSGGSSPPPTAHTPSLMSPTSPTSAMSASFHHSNSRMDRTSEMLRTRKEKSGAPPVSGLLEDISSPAALDKSKMNMSHSRGLFNQSLQANSFCASPHQGMDDSLIYAPNVSTLNTSQAFPRKAPASPAQIDPFYTQGESIRPDDCFDHTWITVFGFPAAASSFILQQFSQYGNIIKHVVATSGNWLHIKYQSKLQAKKALSKNGKVFGNSIMVGVAPCIDKSVMDDKENQDMSANVLNTPTQVSLPGTPNSVLESRKNTPIRPLAAAYKAAAAERQVNVSANNPQKSNGIVTKAMEYIFGW